MNRTDAANAATATDITQPSLADAQLDHIAGGGPIGLILSIYTLGLGCAGLSIAEAAQGRDCGDALNQ